MFLNLLSSWLDLGSYEFFVFTPTSASFLLDGFVMRDIGTLTIPLGSAADKRDHENSFISVADAHLPVRTVVAAITRFAEVSMFWNPLA